ncbi:hypothetical protein ACET3Z_016349 [Daucus carota]
MASPSSSSPKPHHIFQTKVLNAHHDVQQVDEKAKEEEKDLLELRLGRGGPLSPKRLHMGSSSSCSSLCLQQPKQQNVGLVDLNHALPCTMPPAVPSSMPFRVRPQPGLWFTLRSSPTRKREMWLPQIPKMYIRVKEDEKVTVLMVKTYLLTKLGLSNEAQVMPSSSSIYDLGIK